MILPPPALRRLTALKFKGLLRKQARRLRSPSGVVLAILGLLVLSLWLVSLVGSVFLSLRPRVAPQDVLDYGRGVGFFLLLLSATSSLSYRGLFLPREEIELLFSAPLSRGDLVRYRLWSGGLRSLLVSLVMGLPLAAGASSPLCAFAAVVLGLQALGVFGQALAILAGSIEKGFYERWARRPLAILSTALLLLGLAVLMLYWVDLSSGGAPRWLADLKGRMLGGRASGFAELVRTQPLRTLVLPCEPWARLAASPSLVAGWPWLLVCASLWLAGIELVARLPIDFRELSLQTASNLAERVRRARRGGGGASAARVDHSAALRRVPWLFGRGPGGALAWRKTVSMVRKARGTLTLSIVVVLLLGVLATGMGRGGGALGRSLVFAGLGTIYMCGGLRFDFREDLERMEAVKTWPVSPWLLFGATLLPEWALVTAVLSSGALGLCLLAGDFDLSVLLVLLGLPLAVASWIMIDNIVFLYAPTRFVPGQDGTLQNFGRVMIVSLVRFLVVGSLLAAVALAGLGSWLLSHRLLDLPREVALALGGVAAAWVWLVELGALLYAGGLLLRRFDVARERG